MAIGFWSWVFMVVLSAFLGYVGYASGVNLRQARGTTGREIWQAFLTGGIIGVIVGAAAGLVLSIFSIIQLGMSGLLATLVLMIVCALMVGVGFGVINIILTFIRTSLPPQVVGLLAGILCFVAVFAVLFIWFNTPLLGTSFGQYFEAGIEPVAKTLSYGAKELYKWRYCFVADPHCPFYIDWSDANVQSTQEELQVNVNFKEKQIRNEAIDLLAEISVTNPEKYELEIIPRCFLGETIEHSRPITVRQMGTYTEGSMFVFPMSSETLSTSLRCTSDVPECKAAPVCLDQRVFLVLERPVHLEGVWPIYTGERYAVTGPKQVRTELKFNAPYSITLYSSNDMPFDSGRQDGYTFSLAIKQRDEQTKLKDVEKIRLTFPQNVLASCEGFEAQSNDLVIGPFDAQWLKLNVDYDPEELSYIFPCTLIVRNAPITASLSPIGIEADYTVTSQFEAKITKQPG